MGYHQNYLTYLPNMNKGFDYLIYSDKMLDVDKYGV